MQSRAQKAVQRHILVQRIPKPARRRKIRNIRQRPQYHAHRMLTMRHRKPMRRMAREHAVKHRRHRIRARLQHFRDQLAGMGVEGGMKFLAGEAALLIELEKTGRMRNHKSNGERWVTVEHSRGGCKFKTMLSERFQFTRRIAGRAVFFTASFFVLLSCSDPPDQLPGDQEKAQEEARPGSESSPAQQAPAPAVDESPSPASSDTPQPPNPAIPLADDFSLSREWVEAMLEENESRLSEIRQRLQSVRTEIERIESAQAADEDLEALRARLGEILAREQEGLERIRGIASEMKEILDPETSP